MEATCTKCGTTKTLDDFSKNNRTKSGYHTVCKRCRADRAMEYYYDADLQSAVVERVRQRREALKAIIVAAKDVPCTDCGVRYHHYVMDFDHLDPPTKSFKISDAVRRGFKQSTLLAEIDKCEVVCANCHRLRTWESNYRDD